MDPSKVFQSLDLKTSLQAQSFFIPYVNSLKNFIDNLAFQLLEVGKGNLQVLELTFLMLVLHIV